MIIHTTSNKRKYWYQRGREGFSVVPALHQYHCIQAIDSKNKSLVFTDTAEYFHAYLTQTKVTAEYRTTHTIQLLSEALKDVPTSICDSQIAAIEAVRTIFANWRTVEYLPPEATKVLPYPTPVVPLETSAPLRYPPTTSNDGQGKERVSTSKGVSQQQPLKISKNTQIAVNSKNDQEPIVNRTGSCIASTRPPPIQAIQTINEQIIARTRDITLSHKYTTPSH